MSETITIARAADWNAPVALSEESRTERQEHLERLLTTAIRGSDIVRSAERTIDTAERARRLREAIQLIIDDAKESR